jgi:hypothetical protein
MNARAEEIKKVLKRELKRLAKNYGVQAPRLKFRHMRLCGGKFSPNEDSIIIDNGYIKYVENLGLDSSMAIKIFEVLYHEFKHYIQFCENPLDMLHVYSISIAYNDNPFEKEAREFSDLMLQQNKKRIDKVVTKFKVM